MMTGDGDVDVGMVTDLVVDEESEMMTDEGQGHHRRHQEDVVMRLVIEQLTTPV